MTDISSGTLNDPGPLQYHANNAAFYVPASGPNAGIAFRFANMPLEAEGTGPYFTPHEDTLFVNVQHPGELSNNADSPAVFGQPETYGSYWPAGDKTAGRNPSTPKPAMVVITRARRHARAGLNLIRGPRASPRIPGRATATSTARARAGAPPAATSCVPVAATRADARRRATRRPSPRCRSARAGRSPHGGAPSAVGCTGACRARRRTRRSGTPRAWGRRTRTGRRSACGSRPRRSSPGP